jgi:hypothetical protein
VVREHAVTGGTGRWAPLRRAAMWTFVAMTTAAAARALLPARFVTSAASPALLAFPRLEAMTATASAPGLAFACGVLLAPGASGDSVAVSVAILLLLLCPLVCAPTSSSPSPLPQPNRHERSKGL